jgi:glycosyltransferase involved in cell wall biosynthesis
MELSVVIPAYNREWSLPRTIDSVLACGVAAEIIVVDDGSTDRTAEVAREYEPRVKVVQQTNGGPAKARNTGLLHATGTIISFLDSDDTWHPGVVPVCLNVFIDHPDVDVVVGEARFGDEANGYLSLSREGRNGEFRTLLKDPVAPDLYKLDRDAFVKLMIGRMQVFLGSTFIRRSSLDFPGPFDPALFGGEDYELCLRLAAKHKYAFLDVPTAQYEKHPGGISASEERMSREFALVLRSMVRNPGGLTAEERRLVKKRYAQLALWYGYRAYDRGDYAEARTRFAAGLKEGSFSITTAALWLACRLPPPAVRLLRRAKRGVK